MDPKFYDPHSFYGPNNLWDHRGDPLGLQLDSREKYEDACRRFGVPALSDIRILSLQPKLDYTDYPQEIWKRLGRQERVSLRLVTQYLIQCLRYQEMVQDIKDTTLPESGWNQ